MGSYAHLAFDGTDLLFWKSRVDKDVLSHFFLASDFQSYEEQADDDPTEKRMCHKLSTTVKKAKERLNASGYTLLRAKAEFDELSADDFFHYDYEDEELCEKIKAAITFEKWKKAVHKFFRIKPYEYRYGDKTKPSASGLIETMVRESLISDFDDYGFFGIQYDMFNTFRVILEFLSDDDLVECNLSDLIDSGYYTIADFATLENDKRTLILVEGTTDKVILDFAFAKLFPHLYDLFYIVDFDYGIKRDGGTSFLVKNLATFINAKINNRIIGLFDNDAEGQKTKNSLPATLPKNFRVLSYTNIDLGKSYPTLSTTKTLKIVKDDILGRACSIELYLPDTLIQDPAGNFHPIQWQSWFDRERVYQGRISNKTIIFDSFLEYKRKVENGELQFNSTEWQRMKQLIFAIVKAFD